MNREEKWEFMYGLARDYYKTYGNLNIKVNYAITVDGVSYKLGRWVYYQRKQKKYGLLDKTKEDRLNLIKMIWTKTSFMYPYDWQFYFDLVKQYYKENSDKQMPEDYQVFVNQEIIPLGKWLKNEKARSYVHPLTKYQLEQFNKIGLFIPTKNIHNWDFYYDLCIWYYKKNNNLLIPHDYTVKVINENNEEEEIRLGAWLATQRTLKKQGKLLVTRLELLEELNVVWVIKPFVKRRSWDFYYQLLKNYYNENNDINVPAGYSVIYNGERIYLSRWFINVKRKYRENKLSLEQKEALETLGIDKVKYNLKFADYYPLLQKYYELHGNLAITEKEFVLDANGRKFYLYDYVCRLRESYEKGNLTQKQIDLLNAIDMIWHKYDYNWFKMYDYAVKFYKEHGHLNIPFNYEIKEKTKTIKLGVWINSQRKRQKKNILSEEKIAYLEKLNIKWNFKRDWNFYYELLKENFYKRYKHINIPHDYVIIVDGESINLSNWLMSQKHKYMYNKLEQEKVEKLNALNIVWVQNNVFKEKKIENKEELLKIRAKLQMILEQSLKAYALETQEFTNQENVNIIEKAFTRQLNKY